MLALHDGRPFVRHAVEAAREAGLAPVIVVLGHRAEDVSAVLDAGAATLVRNARFAEGLSTSVQAGFAALPAQAEAVVVLLGDMPAIGSALVRDLAEAWIASGRPPALVPTFQGRRGNPVVISRALAPEVATLSGDAGFGPLLRTVPGVIEHPMTNAAIGLDIDTPDALGRLVQASTTPSSTAQ